MIAFSINIILYHQLIVCIMFSGIIVYDSLKDQAWRVMHPSMFPDPDFSDYSIDGEMFSLMDGIVGLAHSPSLGVLYYQPLATDRLVLFTSNHY